MVLEATAQPPQWKDGPLVIPPEFKKFARVMPDGSLFVLTGDIADMWIRDSAAQVWPYRDTHPEMVKRVLQRQGMYILSDPYANSYKDVFRAKVSAADKRLGRGGWVATRNYEVDSGCYFLRLLHHMWKHHGLDARPFESAASALISTWVVEQRHEDQSPYRYPELPRNGKGAKTAYTGMTWGAFRPSDDACKYGYHIPSNLFVAEVMDYAAAMWGGDIRSRALRLQKDVLAGIAAHGIKDGMYCYEVDGLGHCNMMDDANVPSLLSIPYINSRHYDRAIWQKTYAWIWSVSNPYFFVGKEASGIGSPHTPRNHIWPMSIIVRGLVDPSAKSEAVQTIERTRTPAIHESFHKDNAKKFTRPWFGWVNALYSELKGASAPFEPSSGVVGGGEVKEVAKKVEAKTKAREDVHQHNKVCNITRFVNEPQSTGGKSFAYVWYVSEVNYAWSSLVAGEQLRTLGALVPFLWIVTIDLPEEVRSRAQKLGVTMKRSEAVQKGNNYYRFSLNKLKVFTLVEYDRVVFMDADSLPIRNMDSWFHFPAADIVAPCSYWETEPNKFTSFVMTVRPSMDVYFKLLNYTKTSTKADMGVLNAVIKNKILLPSYYGVLNSEWERGDRVYHMHENAKPYIVHFTAKGKPWQHGPGYFKGSNWDDTFRSLHARWWQLRNKKSDKPKDDASSKVSIYNFIHSETSTSCNKHHILKGENKNEPDVHICMDNIRSGCIVYSFGIAYNWIFDDFMLSQGCHVWSFDPSMTLGKHSRQKNHLFEPIGIGPKSGIHTGKSTLYGGKTNYDVLSIWDIMKRHGHTHVDVVRMDVESAEWDTLAAWQEEHVYDVVDQILLEVHMWDVAKHDRYSSIYKNLPYTVFNVRQNKWNKKSLHKDVTQVYEIGLMKHKGANAPLEPRQTRLEGFERGALTTFSQQKRSYLWDTANGKTSSIYSVVYSLIRAFEATGTPVFLYAGSVLGARRHHGLIPWDKDVDLALFSTDTAFINGILNKLKLKWKYNTDGKGPGNTGFGYHIDTTFDKYIDIWLYKKEGSVVKCVGVDNGCIRWHNKYNKEIIEYNTLEFFPPVYAPFGPYMLPIPYDSTSHLNLKYTNNWREKCGGWTRGKTACSAFKNLHPFVKEAPNHREELWKGKSLLHTFSVRNNTYVLERSQSA